jgi:hypothetical protein
MHMTLALETEHLTPYWTTLGTVEGANFRRIRLIGEYVSSGDLVCWMFRELSKRRLRMQSLSSMAAPRERLGGGGLLYRGI